MALTKLTTDLIDGTIVTSVNGSTGAVTLETGTDWQATPKTADFTAVAGKGYFVDTTSAAITVTLPSSPTAGNEINLVDYAGTADTNNIIITSSDNINGAPNDVKIDYERGGVSIIYADATQGWVAYNAANETATALISMPITIIVDYLVIAGGGGGGGTYHGAGGGAGGYRNSYNNETSGGGQSSETSLALDPNTNYTVTVGSGGSGGYSGSGTSSVGNNGSNSVLSTITSIGGGGGGAYRNQPNSGGSGGGSTRVESGYSTGTGAIAVTSPVIHGYAGGNGGGSNPPYGTGGGGGAGAVGGSGNDLQGGDGGDGLQSSITGTTITRGGGGGGSIFPVSGYNPGSGGSGGGGNGSHSAGSNGTANTGGGGGGSERDNGFYSGGNGGAGVVIIRYPNTYTVTIGAGLTGTTATDGSDKVTTFTAGTGTITFS